MTALILALAGVGAYAQTIHLPTAPTLPEARRGFVTNIVVKRKNTDPIPQPPAGFELISYPAPLGSFPAYVTRPTAPGRHPAIIWIAGGFDNSIGDTPWAPATPDNDQSARAFPQAGIITMYPSLRGGNNNPGYNETLYGEVDDVLAAAKYLASRPDVDPTHIYLGGHSTGGTLALLAAESARGFRAVFAFGPVISVGLYGKDNLTFDDSNKMELFLRSPIVYLNTISSPTFVFEGTEAPGNNEDLHKLHQFCKDPQVHFYDVSGFNHFSELAPVTPIIASEIMADTGPQPHFSFITAHPKITPVGP
jgi:acetyl esterase/lipase